MLQQPEEPWNNPLRGENAPLPSAGPEWSSDGNGRWRAAFAAPSASEAGRRWCGWMRPGWRPDWSGAPGPDYEPMEQDIEVSRRRIIVALREGQYCYAACALPAEHAEQIAMGLRAMGLRVKIGPSPSPELRTLMAWASRLGPEWLETGDDDDEHDDGDEEGDEDEE